MNVYIDCEFNSHQGALISMALVDEEGRAFYEAVEMTDPVHPWVAKNVMPVLRATPIERDVFQAILEWWLEKYDRVHLIADWPDDIRYFCEALITGPGTRLNTPPLTMEIRRDLDTTSAVPHNALEDARAIRRKHLAMQ